ncbi:hypothetical protein KP509_33G041300 [Ceratopteris richardii]|uniref:GDSL esterase/lipase n=1 Tax=Ceratopteris richardii TaxID=49495 RepID=A0A8T2QQR2_CERRI|nr:hypothetical protein KP509_33G041300 [Ceratopteris richardii]
MLNSSNLSSRRPKAMEVMGRWKLTDAVMLAISLFNVVGGGAEGLQNDHRHLQSSLACYPALFVFGNSLSDTGNGVLTGNPLLALPADRPYGETVPGYPFNRFSDGLLIIDFLAILLGLPLTQPYLDRSADFTTGINFAVSSATALDAAYLNSIGIPTLSNYSLDVEIGWYLSSRSSAANPYSRNIVAYRHGLYVIEIGGDDYIQAVLSSNFSVPYIQRNLIPLVIAKIRNATEVLYATGARNFLYISITPLGCSPSLLAFFPSGAKDRNGCLIDLNTLSFEHGQRLLRLVYELRATYHDARFVFFDYYGAYEQVISNSPAFGFRDTLDACCGAGPSFLYRYSPQLFCSASSTVAAMTLCPNPIVFLNWDGIHFTHSFNSVISTLTIGSGQYLNPPKAFANCIQHV